MSLCLILKTAGGIVLAGDSRTSYTNESNQQRIATDNTYKVFKINRVYWSDNCWSCSLFI